MKRYFFSALLVTVFGQAALAQRDPGQKRSIMVYTDEDLAPILQFSPDDDRNYTMGFGFGAAWPGLRDGAVLEPALWLAKKINKKYVLADGSWDTELSPSVTLNGTAFTPDELRDVNVNPNDRPYAFLLALSTKYSSLSLTKRIPQHVTVEVALGMLGLDLGKWVQTTIHKGMNDGDSHEPYLPRGWHNQISDGGEPTVLVSYGKQYLLTPKAFSSGRGLSHFELKAGYQAMAGWYTGANIQLGMRVGFLDPINWVQNFNLLGSFNKAMPEGTVSRRSRNEFFIYGTIRPSMILYNELLQGGFRHSAHTFSFGQVQQFTLEWNSGVGLNLPGSNFTTNIIWALNSGRTAEFNTIMKRSHTWGSIYITFNY